MGQELVRSERVAGRRGAGRGNVLLFVALLGISLACRQETPQKVRRANVPQMRVTALVMRTTILPEKKSFVHLVMISGEKVRLSEETDTWRLFDLKNETVTFVDSIAKTYRVVSAANLIRDRLKLVATPSGDSIPPAHFSRGEERTMLGFPARQYLIEAGPYRREIWMSDATPVGDRLFSMLIASEAMSERYASMMREPTRSLVDLKGFPVLDRSDMPYDGSTWTVERRLEKVEKRDVPVSAMTIPQGYRDITPNVPAAGRRSASSPPPDQKTRAGE